uniref:Uncharacterized protein n=1 Tax=Timema monikensis TaxID=170555 RepID=A0A7R9EDM4_9NEOP|nr:unnamed protein product [Timema monikensis]
MWPHLTVLTPSMTTLPLFCFLCQEGTNSTRHSGRLSVDDVKDTKIHSGPPKVLNQPATQGLIQNDIKRKLAPQQPHVHQVQTENRHLQSQCLEADNTGIMPRAKLVYKHRKLATHETKQYEQPICSVQQSHSDLNPLQRQSVVQYPTATTKMASSNIQPQLVSDHTIICIMPKDSQQILQVQDFLSDIGQFDWAKIKEHANSFCILPNGRQHGGACLHWHVRQLACRSLIGYPASCRRFSGLLTKHIFDGLAADVGEQVSPGVEGKRPPDAFKTASAQGLNLTQGMLRNSRKAVCLVSLEIFSKMIEDPNNHSLTNKAVVKIFSNEQSTIDEHQRANTRQQARITTREIKPSEVHQLFIFKDDTSIPQVQMHADCHNRMPMLKPCTAEEFKYLQQNQENNVSHHKNHGFSSSLNNPNPLSSQWSLEDHTISSSISHMETQPTLEINRDVVSSFVGTITPPSAVEDQKPIKDSQSLKNFQQNAINLGQLQNKQLDNKLQQVQETALQNNPLESAAQYQYIKNTNQDVQQQCIHMTINLNLQSEQCVVAAEKRIGTTYNYQHAKQNKASQRKTSHKGMSVRSTRKGKPARLHQPPCRSQFLHIKDKGACKKKENETQPRENPGSLTAPACATTTTLTTAKQALPAWY